MAQKLLLKRGSSKAISSYVGDSGEVVFDTDLNTLRTQDGSTSGGHILALQEYVQKFVLQTLGQTTYYRRPSLFATTKTSITIPKNTQVAISGEVYISNNDTTLQLSSVGSGSSLAGKDVYVYAIPGSSAVDGYYNDCKFVLSLNSTVPTGYTASNSRKIGGFHCLCADVGTISGHTLSGYTVGQIIPNSNWDLLHRPYMDPEGCVFISDLNLWCQIYLPSFDNGKLVSRYNAEICDGNSSTKLNGELFAYYALKSGGRLITRDEFTVVMRGSNEQTNIAGSTDPGTTGGHKDTAGRRMINNYGIEDGCGVLWQWGADCYENYPNSTWNTSNYYLVGYDWQDKSVYHPTYDSQNYGSCFGLLRRCLLGASWGNGVDCGSRAVHCGNFSAEGWIAYSARVVGPSIAYTL